MDKLKITISSDFFAEREYIINVIFGDFLGLDYEVIVEERRASYSIQFMNKTILIQDHFFSRITADTYLSQKYLPGAISTFSYPGWDPLVIIYGANEFLKEENVIEVGLDLFASSYFMLSRWEEYVIQDRDDHNRFDADKALSVKYDFIHRPVVNEYIEFLWHLLVSNGFNGMRRKWEFKFLNTHDVDNPYMFRSGFDYVKKLFKPILALNPRSLIENSIHIRNHLAHGRDPFDTFDYLMDTSEKCGTRSHFFFMAGGETKYDRRYNVKEKRIKHIIDRIKERGHHIGFHPSYDAYNNLEIFLNEKRALEEIVDDKVLTGRQHYLRFEVPLTWQIWEDAKMEWDSTMCYASHPGFRCGICYPFRVFNVLNRKTLKLKEVPLIIMEQSLVVYQWLSEKETTDYIDKLLANVEKYQGAFVFLWHNSSFNYLIWRKLANIYEYAISNYLK